MENWYCNLSNQVTTLICHGGPPSDYPIIVPKNFRIYITTPHGAITLNRYVNNKRLMIRLAENGESQLFSSVLGTDWMKNTGIYIEGNLIPNYLIVFDVDVAQKDNKEDMHHMWRIIKTSNSPEITGVTHSYSETTHKAYHLSELLDMIQNKLLDKTFHFKQEYNPSDGHLFDLDDMGCFVLYLNMCSPLNTNASTININNTSKLLRKEGYDRLLSYNILYEDKCRKDKEVAPILTRVNSATNMDALFTSSDKENPYEIYPFNKTTVDMDDLELRLEDQQNGQRYLEKIKQLDNKFEMADY